MAWLYAVLVVFIFYAPVIGLGSKLQGRGIEILNTGISIPFSESLRPLIYGWLAWFLLWMLTRWIEDRADFNVLYWIDQKLKGLHLRKRWMYVERPRLSLRLASYLAHAGLALCLAKVVGVVIILLALVYGLPWLIETALPEIAAYLLSTLSGIEWIESIAGWLAEGLVEQLLGHVTPWFEKLLQGVLDLNLHPSLLPALVLVLSAARAHHKERRERYWKDLEREQQERRQALTGS